MSEAERAREQQLILDNMGLVVSLARSFSPRNQQELEEYIQSGRIGLWRAVKNYNSSKGALSTLAWNYIRWEIIRNLITMRGQGYTMAEVGSYFGKSRAWAHTVFKKASTKIREANNCNE